MMLDSSVVVAAVAEEHPHNPSSADLLVDRPGRFCIAAHSFAEAYNTLTKRGGGAPYAWPAADAWTALEAVRAATVLVGLTPAQTLDTVRRYAAAGGVGARLYDALIGEAAVRAGIGRIVTWNVGHMRGLFPELEVMTPAEVG